MALFLFTKAILEGRPIDVFNHGKMQRDFTYVDDIAEGVIRVTIVVREFWVFGCSGAWSGCGRRVVRASEGGTGLPRRLRLLAMTG
jgi:hypothetical protein